MVFLRQPRSRMAAVVKLAGHERLEAERPALVFESEENADGPVRTVVDPGRNIS